MPQLNKIDYRKISEQNEKSFSSNEGQEEPQEEKLSGLAALKSRWDFLDKKIKIEIIVFVAVIIGIISMLSISLYNKQPSYNADEFYDESMPEDFIPIDEEGFIQP